MLVHFLATKKGRFERLIFKKKLKYLKFQKFINNITQTSSVKADNDRIGSFTFCGDNELKIKKEIKNINQSLEIKYC